MYVANNNSYLNHTEYNIVIIKSILQTSKTVSLKN